jgi:hypothetical protein
MGVPYGPRYKWSRDQRGPTSGVPLLAVASLDALSFPREDIQSPERFACNTSRLLG